MGVKFKALMMMPTTKEITANLTIVRPSESPKNRVIPFDIEMRPYGFDIPQIGAGSKIAKGLLLTNRVDNSARTRFFVIWQGREQHFSKTVANFTSQSQGEF